MAKIRKRKKIVRPWREYVRSRFEYDWISQAAVPHIIPSTETYTAEEPPKQTLGSFLRKRHYEYMPFGGYRKNIIKPNGDRLPDLKLTELPKSYIVWCLENIDDLHIRYPGLEDRLRQILEQKNNHTLPDNEDNKR